MIPVDTRAPTSLRGTSSLLETESKLESHQTPIGLKDVYFTKLGHTVNDAAPIAEIHILNSRAPQPHSSHVIARPIVYEQPTQLEKRMVEHLKLASLVKFPQKQKFLMRGFNLEALLDKQITMQTPKANSNTKVSRHKRHQMASLNTNKPFTTGETKVVNDRAISPVSKNSNFGT